MVKKLSAILFFLLIFGAMMKLTISIHYCGGIFIASKASLLGRLASCGMQNDSGTCPVSGKNYKSHCCETSIISYSTVNKYVSPSQPKQYEIKAKHFTYFISRNDLQYTIEYKTAIVNDLSPPGNNLISTPGLSFLCVFRI